MNTDKERMDWLERHHVDVRIPLRYGSAPCFVVVPDLEDEVSILRRRVDEAMKERPLSKAAPAEPAPKPDPADPANLTVPYDDLQACATEVLRLEAALRRIVVEGDFTAPEGMKAIAREALQHERTTLTKSGGES